MPNLYTGPGGGSTQLPPPPKPPAPPQPPPANYGTGPPRRGKSSNPPPQSAPDPWAGVPGAVRDQANALVDKFLSTIGYPQGVDATSIAQKLAKSGVNITGSSFSAFYWLYQNTLSDSQRQASPWAMFGMDKDSYNQTVSKLNSVMSSWTGSNFDSLTLRDAIWGSWTPDQIRNFAMFGNAEGTGPMLADAQLSGADPWIGQGQTYTQTLQGFQSFEGSAPADKATLAAWFRFGVGAKQIGAGAEAVGTAAPQQLFRQTSEVR